MRWLPRWPASPSGSTVLLVVALAVGVALAGCVGNVADEPGPEESATPSGQEQSAEPTEPVYDETIREETTVSGEDGTPIWLQIYRPDVPDDEAVPVILLASPYFSAPYGPAMLATNAQDAWEDCEQPVPDKCPYGGFVEFFVPRGYAVAYASVRGTHNSGGCYEHEGAQEQRDGYRVVEWLANRSWANGKVGMTGTSADGATAVYTAAQNPPSLATIVPHAATSNPYEYYYDDGVAYWHSGWAPPGPPWRVVSDLPHSAPGQDPDAIEYLPDRASCVDERLESHTELSGDMIDYWRERDHARHAPNVTAAVLQTHGYEDRTVYADQVVGWFDELVNATERRLLLTQYGHGSPGMYFDWWTGQGGVLHRWMDHFLQGIDTGLLDELPTVMTKARPDPVDDVPSNPTEDAPGEWRGLTSFPPRDQPNRTYHLSADEQLSTEPGEAGTMTIWDAPRERAGRSDTAMTAANAALDRTDRPPTKVVFVSEPLEEDLHITGVPTLTINATTSEDRTRWAASLSVLGPEAPPTDDGEELTFGYQNTRHLDGVRSPQEIPAGTPYEAQIEMQPRDTIVPAGSQLRLGVSNWDQRIIQDTTYAESTIRLGDGGSTLTLPLDPGGIDWSPGEVDSP